MWVYKWETNETHNLPSAYQEVEYLENNWTCYIDTWLQIKDGYRSVQKLRFLDYQISDWGFVTWGYIWPDSWLPWGHARLYVWNWRNWTTWWSYGYLDSYTNWTTATATIGTDYEMDFSWVSGNAFLKIDWTSYFTSSTTYSTNLSWPVSVFAGYEPYSSQVHPWLRVYYAKYYDSTDTLVRDFIPCYRIADWVIWLYDLVNEVFYTNSWTWTFTKGLDVNDYKEKKLKNAYIGIPDPTSIVLDKISIILTTVGQTEQLTATIEPTVSDKTITWTTSDSTVATVSTTGLVTCVTPWTATITVTTVNGLTASCGVTYQQWWQPWANTIAYYSLTSSSTTNDESGNGYNLTNSWATFGTYGGVDCVYLDNTDSKKLYATIPWLSGNPTFTVNVYVNRQWTTNSDWWQLFVVWSVGSNLKCYWNAIRTDWKYLTRTRWWGEARSTVTNTLGVWELITVVKDGSNTTVYRNASEIASWTITTNISATDFTIGSFNSRSTYYQSFYWYLSEFIVEDKVRTAQEIADYYNQTKSLYGIN